MSGKRQKLIARIIVALLIIGLVLGTAYGIGEVFVSHAEEPGGDQGDTGDGDTGQDTGDADKDPGSSDQDNSANDSNTGSNPSGGTTVVVPPPPKPNYSSPSFRITASQDMKVGEKQAIVYSLSGAATDTKITWSSGNTKVAIVDQTGMVVAVSAGTAEIIAVAAGIKRSVIITVSEETAESIRIISDEFKAADITGGTHHLFVGDKITLNYEIQPETVRLTSAPAWESSDENVIKVYDDGVIKAVGTGNATITITFDTLVDTAYFVVSKKPFPWGIILLVIFVIIAGLFFILLRQYLKRRMAQKQEDEFRAKAVREKRRRQNNTAGKPYPQQYPDGMQNKQQPESGYQDRDTKVYGYPESPPEEEVNSEQREKFDDWGLEDKPFTLDDID